LTFSLNLGMQFLSDYYGIIPDAKLPHFHVSLIRRIKALEEFKNTSRFCLCHQKNLKKVPKQFEEVFNCYQKLCYDVQLLPKTIESKSYRIINFLTYLDEKKINNLSKLSITHIYDYVKSLNNYSSQTKSGILFTLRDFLKFLFKKNLVSKNISNAFPVIVSNKF